MKGSYTPIQETKECRPMQIKTNENNNNKHQTTTKLRQKNKKSKSVMNTIQIPKDCRNKNMKSRSHSTPGPKKPRSESISSNPMSTISDIHELRSKDKDSTPQRMTSVAGHPKNRLYINNGESLHILFNKELMGGLQNLDRPLKIQAGGKPIHMSQVESLHHALQHLPLPATTYYYSETTIVNLLLFAKLVDEFLHYM